MKSNLTEPGHSLPPTSLRSTNRHAPDHRIGHRNHHGRYLSFVCTPFVSFPVPVSALTHRRAMASVPISGELAQKYGYLSLSIYSGVSLLVGGLLLALARLAQSRRLLDAI